MAEITPVVFIVDDDIAVRESLEALVADCGWQAETFATAGMFLSRPRARGPNCLVLDVHLPDLSGLEVQRRVSGLRRDMPIIFITGCDDIATTVQAMKAGAVEFLGKPFTIEVIVGAIASALELSRRYLETEAAVRVLRDRYASLTRREREVMALVVLGRLNKQVGGDLAISEITVKAHRGRVMRKMCATSLPDLVNMASRLQHDPVATGRGDWSL